MLVGQMLGQYLIWQKKYIVMKLQKKSMAECNVKHWHGATKNSWFSHIAVEVTGENASTEWLEAVKDEEYNKL